MFVRCSGSLPFFAISALINHRLQRLALGNDESMRDQKHIIEASKPRFTPRCRQGEHAFLAII